MDRKSIGVLTLLALAAGMGPEVHGSDMKSGETPAVEIRIEVPQSDYAFEGFPDCKDVDTSSLIETAAAIATALGKPEYAEVLLVGEKVTGWCANQGGEIGRLCSEIRGGSVSSCAVGCVSAPPGAKLDTVAVSRRSQRDWFQARYESQLPFPRKLKAYGKVAWFGWERIDVARVGDRWTACAVAANWKHNESAFGYLFLNYFPN